MQPLLNASKVWQTILWFLKKREPTKKHLSLGTDVDEPKTSSFVNPRMWNNFIVKFQNLKQIITIESTKRKLMWKVT